MGRTKKVTITMSQEQQDKGKELSKQHFGYENLSGWLRFKVDQGKIINTK